MGQVLRESPGWGQFDGHSDLVSICICRLDGGRVQQMNNGACQHFCPGQSCPSSPFPKPDNSVPPYMSLALIELLPQHWSSQPMSSSARKSMWGLLRGMPEIPEPLYLIWTEFPLMFTARCCGDDSFWYWWRAWCGGGTFHSSGGTATVDLSFLILTTCGCAASPFLVSVPTSLDMASLYP